MKTLFKDSFDLHAWLGVWSSALLFIVAFSGSIALFHSELATWENPEYRIPFEANPHGIDAHLEKIASESGFDHQNFLIFPPSHKSPVLTFSHFDPETHHSHMIQTRPSTMEILEQGDSDMAHLLAHLHTDLHLPSPYGRYLVGFAGVVMMVLLVTGVISHRKLFKELFLWRRKGSLRAFFSSSHKLLGVWGLPFHLMMAFTGAIIGLLGIIGVFMALASFGGSVEKATQAVLGPRAEASGESAPMMTIDSFVEKAKSKWDGFEPTFITVQAYKDKEALVTVSGNVAGRLAMGTGITGKMTTGEVIHVQDWHQESWPTWIFGMVVPLHYALYGGVWIKYLYFLLGLGMTFLIASGTTIWLMRREQTRQRSGAVGTSNLTKFHVGVCGGLVLATAMAFLGTHLPVPITQSLLEGGAFWGGWFVGIAYCFLVKETTHAMRNILSMSAVVLIAAAFVNMLTTGDFPWVAWAQGYRAVAVVDFFLISIGATLLFTLWSKRNKARKEAVSLATASVST